MTAPIKLIHLNKLFTLQYLNQVHSELNKVKSIYKNDPHFL